MPLVLDPLPWLDFSSPLFVVPRIDELPWSTLTPNKFQLLMRRIALEVFHWTDVYIYGREGDRQHGVDIIGQAPEGAVGMQVKRRTSLRGLPSLLKSDFEKLVRGGGHLQVKRFVFAAPADLQAKSVQDMRIALQRTAPFRIELVGIVELHDALRRRPDLVAEAFGEIRAIEFCASASLRGVLMTRERLVEAVRRHHAAAERLCQDLPIAVGRTDLTRADVEQRVFVTQAREWTKRTEPDFAYMSEAGPLEQLLLESACNYGRLAPDTWRGIERFITRGFVIGAGGIGKTFALYSACQRALHAAQSGLAAGHRDVVVPVYVTAMEVIRRLVVKGVEVDTPLTAEALAGAIVSTLAPQVLLDGPYCDTLARHLSAQLARRPSPRDDDGKLFRLQFKLYIDGVDEIPKAWMGLAVRVVKMAIGSRAAVVLVGTRSSAVMQLVEAAPAPVIELLGFGRTEIGAYVSAWAGGDDELIQQIHRLLDNSALMDLARIPLLLMFLCLVAEGGDVKNRADLYEKLLRYLFGRAWRHEDLRESDARRIDDKIELLSEVAWTLGATSATSTAGLSEGVLIAAMEASPRFAKLEAQAVARYKEQAVPGAPEPRSALLHELIELDSVLVRMGLPAPYIAPADVPIAFLHRSIHEFLIARFIAVRQLEDSVTHVKDHAWMDPSWVEVIPMLVGCLAERNKDVHAAEIMWALLDEDEGDPTIEFLLAAGRCVPEVWGWRCHAAAGEAVERLLKHLMTGRRRDRDSVIRVLRRIGGKALPGLAVASRIGTPEVKIAAVTALGLIGHPDGLSAIRSALDGDEELRLAAVIGIGKCGDPAEADLVADMLRDHSPAVHVAAFSTLRMLDPARARKEVLSLLSPAEKTAVRANAATSVGECEDNYAARRLRALAADTTEASEVLLAVLNAMAKRPRPQDVPLVRRLLARESDIRRAACRALGAIGTAEAIDLLRTLCNDPVRRVQREALRAYVVADPEDFADFLGDVAALRYTDRQTLASALRRVRRHVPAAIRIALANDDADDIRRMGVELLDAEDPDQRDVLERRYAEDLDRAVVRRAASSLGRDAEPSVFERLPMRGLVVKAIGLPLVKEAWRALQPFAEQGRQFVAESVGAIVNPAPDTSTSITARTATAEELAALVEHDFGNLHLVLRELARRDAVTGAKGIALIVAQGRVAADTHAVDVLLKLAPSVEELAPVLESVVSLLQHAQAVEAREKIEVLAFQLGCRITQAGGMTPSLRMSLRAKLGGQADCSLG